MRKLLLTMVALAVCAAFGYENDGPGYDPSVPRPQTAKAVSTFAPPEESDVMMVTTSGGDIGITKGPNAKIVIPLKIDRCFGDREKLLDCGALPEEVEMTMVVYDVDSRSTSHPPERDEVYVNNVHVGTLWGDNEEWYKNTFSVPVSALNLSKNGEDVDNTLTIEVDYDNTGWVTEVQWVSLEIKAPPPVVLAHGINSSAAGLSSLKAEIESWGLPVYAFNFPNNGNDSIMAGAATLGDAVDAAKKKFKVEHVNVVAHSMGGLKAREYAEHAQDVLSVLQIATPNAGSPIADIALKCRSGIKQAMADYEQENQECLSPEVYQGMENFLVQLVSLTGNNFNLMRDEALVDLSTESMHDYNQHHSRLNPDVKYRVVAGSVPPDDGVVAGIAYNELGESDLIVPVSSAHAMIPHYQGSPLEGTSSLCSHSGLIRGGVASTVDTLILDLIRPIGRNGRLAASVRMDQRTPASGDDGFDRKNTTASRSGVAKVGEETMVEFEVLKGNQTSVSMAIGNCAEHEMRLVAPNGSVLRAADLANIGEVGSNSESFILDAPQKGVWKFYFTVKRALSAGCGQCLYYLDALEQASGLSVEAKLAERSVRRGSPFRLDAIVKLDNVPVSGSVQATVECPDGGRLAVPFTGGSDGRFSAEIPTAQSGRYQVTMTVKGYGPATFTRSCMISGVAYDSQSAFSGTVTANGLDSNANGLYDDFAVDFPVDVTAAAKYRVLATLFDTEGRFVDEAWTKNLDCSVGRNTFRVPFSGERIFAHGACNGYVVSEVKLIEVTDTYEAVVDERKDIFCTTAYNYRQFEHPLITFGGNGSDSAADTDGDGIYDRLTVNLPLSSEPQVAGNYDWSAALQDGEGTTLGFVAGSVVLPSAGGTTMVTMTFEGSDILKTDLNGPYYLRNFILWNNTKTFTLVDEYATKAYRLRDWGGVARHLSSFDFMDTELSVDEGRTLKVEIAPGDHMGYCSVQVFLTHGTTNAKDLALPKGRTFPFTVSWEAGDLTAKTIEIPIAADKAVEGAEEFYLQLANAEGMEIGENKLCTVTVRDMTVADSLAQALNSSDAKASSKGQGKWFAAPGCEYHFADVNRGVNHVESPALAQGQSSTLMLSAGKGPGKFVVIFRFTGNEREVVSSTLEIYAGKEYLRNYIHASTGNGWQKHTITDPNKGSHKYSYVFKQGSDPDAHVEFVGAYWVSQGVGDPVAVVASANDAGKGRVTGCGYYRYGATVKITAKPNPGRTFSGWYRWSKANNRYEEYSKSANLTFKATEEVDLQAVFTDLPIVRVLPNPPDGGTVTGAGRYAAGKKVTLKAKANKGCVFRGWYDVTGALLSQDAKYTFAMPEGDVALTAAFVTAAEDLRAISLTVAGVAADAVQPLIASNVCGVAVNWPLVPVGLSATTVKAAGLPAGVKLVQDKKAKVWSLFGVPTKTGPYTAKLTVTTAAKNSQVFLINGMVTALPGAAVGTFNGLVSAYDESAQQFYRSSSVASAVLTTTGIGGITLKLTTGSGAVSLTQKGWTELLGRYCHAELKSKKGETVNLYVDTQPSDWTDFGHVFGFVSGGSFGSTSYYLEMQRSAFVKSKVGIEHPEAFMLADSLAGTYWFNVADKGNKTYEIVPAADKSAQFSVNVKSSGSVQVSGKIAGMKISAATELRPHPSDSSADVFCCALLGKTTPVSIILRITPQGVSGAIYF